MGNFRLRDLKPRYEELFTTCKIRSSWFPKIGEIARTIVSLRSRYYDAIQVETTVPWWFVGILHYREATFGEAHLHNGDPLTARTIQEPPGRPQAPPRNGYRYTFEESAIDALRWKTYDTAQDRSIAAWLWRFELWNGFGYAMRGINSEYLWNGSNHFGSGNNRGKYVADGSFDPNAQSTQAGAAAIMWYMHHNGMLDTGIQELVGTPASSSANTTASFSTPTGVSPVMGQQQVPVQLSQVFRQYQNLPHQDAAIAWLQQQQQPAVLAEFTRLWRNSSANGVLGTRVQDVAMVGTPVMPRVRQMSPPVFQPPPVIRLGTLEERIIAYCEEKGCQIDRKVGEKNIIYIEGMYPDGQLNNDELNAWNDTRLVIEFIDGVPKIIGAWEATTEPGRYYTMSPLNPGGAARIAFGQHKAWQIGTHGQSDPHEALIQTGGEITVYRDLNQDGMRLGDRTDTGYFYVNQHWGGDSPESDIGLWSAGCLVGRTRDGHMEFMSIIKQDPRYASNRGYVFSTIVISGDALFKRYPPS